MATDFQDGFDHYGAGDAARARMLGGVWAQLDTTNFPGVVTSNPTPRTGLGCLGLGAVSVGTWQARVVLDNPTSEKFVTFAFYARELPLADGTVRLSIRDGSNTEIVRVSIDADGSVKLRDSGGSVIAGSGANVIRTGTWHSISMHIDTDIGSAQDVFELRVDGETIIDEDDLTLAGDVGQLSWVIGAATGGGQPNTFYIDDIYVNSAEGTYNNDWPGDTRIVAIYPRADDEQGWTANRRHKYGNGILEEDGSGDAVTAADSPQLEFGDEDFTVEGYFRFLDTPQGSNRATLFAKWRESTNERSFRFFLGGPALNNGNLEFQISTTGAAGGVVSLASAGFTPVKDHWYHIVAQRGGGEFVMFVDGVPLTAPVADANEYHNNASLFCIGGQQDAAATIGTNTSVNGFIEEVRVTQGLARYNPSGFVPPTSAFPRDISGDPDFADVVLLAGFDTSIIDESLFARTLTARGQAARNAPDDAAPGDYKTVNQSTPRDDTGVEAPYVAASNVLTFAGQAAAAETVVVDGNTYTWEAAFSDTAGNVLIGATINESIDNLVAAINGDPLGEGVVYGTGTSFSADASAFNIDNNQMRVVANVAGAAGNAITSTTTMGDAAWANAATLAGGLDIPGPSSFFITRLPPATTGVRAITLVTRARKSDDGPAKIQASFVTADDSSANGAEHPVTVNDAYHLDIIEQDPGTLGALTTASFVGARIRVDRTE